MEQNLGFYKIKKIKEEIEIIKRCTTFPWKKCSSGVGGPPSRGAESQTSRNVGSKRVRESAPDSGESFKAGNIYEMKDAYGRENDIDPSGRDAGRSSRQKQQHVWCVETSESDDFEVPYKGKGFL